MMIFSLRVFVLYTGVSISVLTLLIGQQEQHLACKKTFSIYLQGFAFVAKAQSAVTSEKHDLSKNFVTKCLAVCRKL